MLKLKLQHFGHLMWRADSLEKTLMLGKIEGRRRGTTEDEMVGWHHRLDGHESEQTPGVGEGEGGLACCDYSWGRKESDTTEQLNWTELWLLWIINASIQVSVWVIAFNCGSSVTKPCLTPCDPMNCSMLGFPVLHYVWVCHTPVHWVSDAIQPSHSLCSPFSCLQSFPPSGSFPMSQFFPSGGQSFGASASASVLPMNIQDWFPVGLTDVISLLSKGFSRVFSSTTFQKHQFFSAQVSLWYNFHIRTWLLEKT